MDPDVTLDVEDLVKKHGDVTAVDGVSFKVPKGTIFCLLGLNGAGKTTTLEVAQGVRKPTAGRARLFGVDAHKAPPELKRRMGVLPQRWIGFPLFTVREHVEYYAAMYDVKPDVPLLLKTHGLAEVANRPYRTLSGGMRQRVGIATAVVNDPDLVFLDEPTASVDPANRRRLWDVILDMKKAGRSIVLTTHYMDEAERLADDIAVIHRGKIIASGRPEEICRKHGAGALVRVTGLVGDLPPVLANRAGITRGPEGLLTIPLTDISEGPLVLAEIVKSGIHYREVSVREDSLDDTFVRLVSQQEGSP